jgi:hypothetical protein
MRGMCGALLAAAALSASVFAPPAGAAPLPRRAMIAFLPTHFAYNVLESE